MDRRVETIPSAERSSRTVIALHLCVHSFPPYPLRPSEDTVNERMSYVCLGLCMFVQETVRNPGQLMLQVWVNKIEPHSQKL